LACFEQAQRINPNNEDALWQQGDALVQMEHYEEALEVAQTLTRRMPKDWKAWSNYAWCSLKLGLYDQVIPAVRKMNRLSPKNPSGYEMLGIAMLETGHPDKALPQYEQVIKLDPDDWAALGSKGYCLLLMGRYKEALKCYEKVTREVDDDHEYWNCMGVALHKLKRDDEALKCYQKALELYPEYAVAISNIADVHCDRKEYPQAEMLYRKAYGLDPENRRSDLFSVALCMFNTKRFADMVPLLQPLLPYAKEDEQNYAILIGVSYKNLQQYEEAIRYFKMQLENSQDGPYSSACWFNIALCEKELKHLNEAEATLKKALELFDSDEEKAMCHFGLGELYLEQKQYSQALEHLDQAVALDPEIEDYAAAREVAIRRIEQSQK
jgi:tetratricopeptide (TPR) repeat protein